MNQNSEMTRWTMPTKPEFFALHKSAINLYDTVAVIVQGIWLLFSVSPFAALIEGNVPSVANYALPIAFGLLLYLHYVLHELLRYVFYNQLDNDPNTVNSIMHYAVISVIVLGMFILDLQGTTRFLRKENTYKTERTAEESAHRTDLSELRSRQQSEIALIDNAANADVKAIETAYASRISTTKARRAFDQWDINKRNADSRKLEAERDGKTANRTAQAGEAKSRLLGQHTSERNRLTGNIDHRVATIDAADATNAADSSTYGWVVSLICLLVLLGCTFQCTTLRVSAGQKPVSRFTIADATGSVNNKAFDALQDIWHRVAHQFIANFHHWATSKSRDLDTLDGAFRLKTRDGSAATQAPPPPPPSSDGSTPSVPPPSPAEQLQFDIDANLQAAMVQPTATLKSITQPFKSFSERDKRDIAQSSYDEKTHAYYYGDWVTALEDLNCVCGINATAVAVDGLEEAVKLATAYANKRRNPDPIGDYLDSVGMPIVTDAERAAFHATPSVAAPVIEPDDSDETPQDVYTTYIRGYVKTGDSEYRNPTQFITLLRNAYTRGYAEKVALRRAQLLAHLDDKNITAEIVKFIKNNEQMVGDTVCQKFNSVMEGEANA